MKKGTPVDLSHTVYVTWLRMEHIGDVRGWPVAAFIAAYPQGRFIVHRRGHAFAVVDGVLHDWKGGTKVGSKILDVWRVTEATQEKIERTKGLFV
jgi:hypothetical protein